MFFVLYFREIKKYCRGPPTTNPTRKITLSRLSCMPRLMEIILGGLDGPIQEVIKTIKPEIQPDKIPRVLERAYGHQHLLQSHKLRILGILSPRQDWDPILELQPETINQIVYDYQIIKLPPQYTQILDIIFYGQF